jgi:hypothetical protein
MCANGGSGAWTALGLVIAGSLAILIVVALCHKLALSDRTRDAPPIIPNKERATVRLATPSGA